MLSALLLLSATASAEQIIPLTRSYTSVYLVVGEGGMVLVDAHYPDRTEWIASQLAERGISISDIGLVIVTHGHSDHAGSMSGLQAGGLEVAVGEGDVWMVERGAHDEEEPTGFRGRMVKPTIDPEYPAAVPDLVVSESLDLSPYGVAGEVRVVGGHSPGSLVVALDDGQAMVGDLIRGRMVRNRRPTLHFFHADTDAAHAALQALVDEGYTTFYPGHGGPLPADRVARWLARR